MGVIGRELPKVLWPIFEANLLSLQIDFLKKLSIANIFANTHHQHEKVEKYLKENFPEVNTLYESDLLDAGGGVHNFIINTNVDKPFVVINSDQYFHFEKNELDELFNLDNLRRANLMALPWRAGYSGLELNQNGELVNITKNTSQYMYSGLCVVNPKRIVASSKPSKFFESVCNYKKEKVGVITGNGEFYDFGELTLYARNCHQLLALKINNNLDVGFIDQEKINKKMQAYACDQENVLNFSNKELRFQWPKGSIILEEDDQVEPISYASACVIYRNHVVNI